MEKQELGKTGYALNDPTAPIGVFDSGVGGLTVAREIMRQIPNERLIYFGDTARVPYGNKSKETVTKFSKQIVRFLKTQRVKAIVIACNTASAYALDEIEKELDIPIIGVVKPGARVAAEVTKNKKVGVIATAGTIQSRIYTDYIQGIQKDIQVIGKACPLFVPLVEEGLLEDPVTDEIATRYLNELKDIDIDTLILGCTHYPLIRSTLGRIMGESVTLVNPAYETARELKELLAGEGLLNPSTKRLGTNQYQFFVSDGADKFKTFANSILKYGILSAQIIHIEEY
ncbi:MAG: glutamate racemase [Lachnospiraceae bacterium]|nr:glutamate racemase [Lachnospiraceae bacterium]